MSPGASEEHIVFFFNFKLYTKQETDPDLVEDRNILA
jgi:hypothetical protein